MTTCFLSESKVCLCYVPISLTLMFILSSIISIIFKYIISCLKIIWSVKNTMQYMLESFLFISLFLKPLFVMFLAP